MLGIVAQQGEGPVNPVDSVWSSLVQAS
uniref:TOR n=1 Tax=Arundo donax TaxID=35708 RepID=A0A0A9EP65_ARUDO